MSLERENQGEFSLSTELELKIKHEENFINFSPNFVCQKLDCAYRSSVNVQRDTGIASLCLFISLGYN